PCSTTALRGTPSIVKRNTSDCGKRKLTTYKDPGVFEAYSQLCALNVRPRSLSDLPQATDIVRGNSLTNSQPVYNQASGLVFVPTQVLLSRTMTLFYGMFLATLDFFCLRGHRVQVGSGMARTSQLATYGESSEVNIPYEPEPSTNP
ncbi:hypothetical protein Tco_0929281, partial [Tanacetum coccineum]